MALFCPVWLHLMAPSAADEVGPALEALCHEHIAVVYAARSPAAAGLADAVAEELAVPVRIDADLDALDVAGFGHGGHPSSHCAEALQSIADAGNSTVSITNGTASGNMTIDADGLGTLKLPMGITLNNVLRVRNVLDLSLSAGLFSSKVKQFYYSYFTSTSKFPVLTINYSWVKLNFSGTPTINPVVDGNIGFFTAVPEIRLNDVNLVSVLPNPASNDLILTESMPGSISSMELMNAQGQIVYHGAFTKHLNVEQFSRGFYLATFHSGFAIIRKKILLE